MMRCYAEWFFWQGMFEVKFKVRQKTVLSYDKWLVPTLSRSPSHIGGGKGDLNRSRSPVIFHLLRTTSPPLSRIANIWHETTS